MGTERLRAENARLAAKLAKSQKALAILGKVPMTALRAPPWRDENPRARNAYGPVAGWLPCAA
jgi:hypothetical protein